MSYGEFLAIIQLYCSVDVVEFAKDLIDENTTLNDQVYELEYILSTFTTQSGDRRD